MTTKKQSQTPSGKKSNTGGQPERNTRGSDRSGIENPDEVEVPAEDPEKKIQIDDDPAQTQRKIPHMSK